MKVSLIIPTLNEQNCIGKVLNEIPRNSINEILIIDGHSSDNTRREARSVLKKSDKLIVQTSSGYGGAFIEGFQHVTGDIVILMDGDGSHDPKYIPKLIKKIHQGYEYVIASRYMPGGSSDDDTTVRWFGNQLFTWLTNIIYGTKVTDSLYLFTAITRKGLNQLTLNSSGFEFCTEILVKAHRAGLKFAEVRAHERARYSGRSKVNALLHGWQILKMILKNYK